MKVCSKSQMTVVGLKSISILTVILLRQQNMASYVSCFLFDVKGKYTGAAFDRIEKEIQLHFETVASIQHGTREQRNIHRMNFAIFVVVANFPFSSSLDISLIVLLLSLSFLYILFQIKK